VNRPYLPFPAEPGDDDDAVEPSRIYHRARPMQSLTTLINGTEENHLHFCTEVANYQRAVTRQFADGVTARESRACKRKQEAIARRQPAIVNDPRTGGLIGLRRYRATAAWRGVLRRISRTALCLEHVHLWGSMLWWCMSTSRWHSMLQTPMVPTAHCQQQLCLQL
jgi:hypothetical protein